MQLQLPIFFVRPSRSRKEHPPQRLRNTGIVPGQWRRRRTRGYLLFRTYNVIAEKQQLEGYREPDVECCDDDDDEARGLCFGLQGAQTRS